MTSRRKKPVPRKRTAMKNKKSSPGAAARARTPRPDVPAVAWNSVPLVVFTYRYKNADDHGFIFANAQTKRLLGLAPAELTKKTGGLRLHPDDVETFDEHVLRPMAAGASVDVQVRVLMKSSQTRWIHIAAWPHRKEKGAAVYNGVILDIHNHKKTQTEQIETLERMEHAQDIAKLGWYDMNLKDQVMDLTNEFADSLGLPFAPGGRVRGKEFERYREAFLNAIHPDDRARYAAIIADKTWRRAEFDYRVITRTNEIRHLCSRIQRTVDKKGKRIRDFAVILDVTERKKLEEELRAQAATDPLTGVPNRRSFDSAARREVERARRYAKSFTVIAIDIDHFKRVNDTYGHDVGDIVLRSMTKTCLEKLRITDVLARLGGEEFAVLLPETSLEAAIVLAERLRVGIATTPIESVKGQINITVSLGVAQFALNEPTIDLTLKRADEALYKAKREGRDRVEVAPAPAPLRAVVTNR
ncbi:MAG: diguanylate cyclase [Rhodospirillaceae bacterium]|nr:diguanylate cyclase [Rhodospirillaceae bacterium]